MTNVNVFVWHDARGTITAIGRELGEVGGCTPIAGEDQSVIAADVEDQSIANLYKTHMVDVSRKLIIKHPQEKNKERISDLRESS
jgi:hypothetical protein